MCSLASGAWAGTLPEIRSWVCYYGAKPLATLSRFDLAVLEPGNLPAPRRTKSKPLCLGYVSLGEVNTGSRAFETLKDMPFLLDKNEVWNSRMVDIRDPAWRDYVLSRLIPEVLARGYDGVFLDTLDSSLHLEEVEPARFQGMREAALELVRAMRRAFPDMVICVNRAAPLWPELAPTVQFVLAESLFGDYDFEAKRYVPAAKSDRDQLVGWADAARRVNPALSVLSLDYVDPRDRKMMRQALAFSRQHGFIPYVSTPNLDAIHTRTLRR